jgi:glycosyltransferase involved in cell wall biosynthesis
MKILQVHNRPRQVGYGGDVAVDRTIKILKSRNQDIKTVIKSSIGLDKNLATKIITFFNGIYSISAYKELKKILIDIRPDIVHIHNLYPLLSPSILDICKTLNVPTVVTCHSFYMICPSHFFLSKGKICEKCLNGKEYFCILNNCRNNIFESIAYPIRYAFARKLNFFKRKIKIIIALSEFAKKKFIEQGFEKNRISVIRNTVRVPETASDPQRGEYILFAGRLSHEKGVAYLLKAINSLPNYKFCIAGDGPLEDKFINNLPGNSIYLGKINRDKLENIYNKARLLIIPSLCYEMCPMTALEGM